jgi:hypothetical protein
MFPCGSSPRSAWLADSSPPATPWLLAAASSPPSLVPLPQPERSALLLNWHRPNLSPFSKEALLKGPWS